LPKTGRGAADVEWVAFFPVTREIQRQSRREERASAPAAKWRVSGTFTFARLEPKRFRSRRI